MLSRINQGRSMEIERGRGRPKEKPHLREHLGFVRAVERQVDAHHLVRLRAHEDALVLGPGVPADGAHVHSPRRRLQLWTTGGIEGATLAYPVEVDAPHNLVPDEGCNRRWPSTLMRDAIDAGHRR